MSNNPKEAVILECIDGVDDHCTATIEPGSSISIGHMANDPNTSITELNEEHGNISFTYNNGLLMIDASSCKAVVKLNGNPVIKNSIGNNDILRIGQSIWKANFPAVLGSTVQQGTGNALKNQFGSLIGLEGLHDFKFRSLFSQVFKKHSFTEMEDQLITGTSSNTPAITDIETSWAKPWLFSRLLLLAVILSVALAMGVQTFENVKIIPGLIFIGTFAVPVSTLIFFLELNAPRNISIFLVVVLLFIGGVASLILALVFFKSFDFLSGLLGVSAAGIIEETAKLLIIVGIFGRAVRYKWVLNGLLFGAAIGCGFGAFESAGYALESFLGQGGFGDGVYNIALRGLLAPFMHIVWTANAAAALWLVKGDKKFAWNMLANPRFLRVMIASMLLHMTWNAPFTTISLPVVLDLKFPVLGIIAWAICFRLVQAGLKQLNDARRVEVDRLSAS
ncbi:MAG: PrsW family glutamic-type intramembrane protease [Chitinophagaceae bacterium]